MEAIFDRNGKTIGWLNDDVIYDRHNRYRAFVSDENIVSYGSQHLGTLDNGIFRDKNGNCVAFMDGASGGPPLPLHELPPLPPPAPLPPVTPPGTLNWSHLNWEQYLGG